MKNSQKTKFLSLLLTVALIATFFASTSFASTPYEFKDPVIEQAVIAELAQKGIVTAPTVADLNTLTSLWIYDSVTTWEDLTAIPQFQILYLSELPSAERKIKTIGDASTYFPMLPNFHTVSVTGLWDVNVSDFLTLSNYNIWGTSMASATEAQQSQDAMDAVLARIIHDGMADFDKILAVHDWAVRELTYSEYIPNNYYSANGAFLYGGGLCGTYSYAAIALLNRMGIPAYYTQGRTGGGAHAWVAVLLDGEWVNMDILWDDSGNDSTLIKYDFFLVSDAELREHDATRTWRVENPVDTLDSGSPFTPVADTLNQFNTFEKVSNRVSVNNTVYFANPSDGNRLYSQAYNSAVKELVVNAPVARVRLSSDKIVFTNTDDGLVYSINYDGTGLAPDAYPAYDSGSGATLSFPDPLVDKFVRAASGVYGRDITAGDVVNVKNLGMSNSNPFVVVSSLEGLQHIPSLMNLYVPGNFMPNSVTDISMLSGLTNLYSLNIQQHNNLIDISSVAALHNLNNLNLYGNKIQDVSPIQNLTPRSLNLGVNNISDVSPLANMGSLYSLNVSNNPNLSSVLPLANVNINTFIAWDKFSYIQDGDGPILQVERAIATAEVSQSQADIDVALLALNGVFPGALPANNLLVRLNAIVPVEDPETPEDPTPPVEAPETPDVTTPPAISIDPEDPTPPEESPETPEDPTPPTTPPVNDPGANLPAPPAPMPPAPPAPPAAMLPVTPIAPALPPPTMATVAGLTETTETVNGVKSVITTIDSDFFTANAPVVLSGGQKAVVLEVRQGTTDQATIRFNGNDLSKIGKNTDLAIRYGGMEYVMPSAELGLVALQGMLGIGADFVPEITFSIRQTSASEAVSLLKHAKSNTYSIVVEPTIFEVVAKADGKSVNLDTFKSYVTRVIALPEGVDAKDVTTGVVINPDGSLSPVPTEFYTQDGVVYAKIKSMTNSAYTVISKNVSVASVLNHWAMTTVTTLANRLIIVNPDKFSPNAAITRGEYLTYLLKGLGLYRSGLKETVTIADQGSLPYKDALTIAVQRGIMTGYGEDIYKADVTITRQEAMVIAARAMKVVGLKTTNRNRAKSFGDFDTVGTWATEGVVEAVGAGIVNGSNGKIHPNGTITYAESAQIVKNFMIKGGLMQEE